MTGCAGRLLQLGTTQQASDGSVCNTQLGGRLGNVEHL